MKRAIIIVIDSAGCGAMHDAPNYGDLMECNTFVNVANFNNGLNLPNLEKMGLGNIDNIKGVKPVENPTAICTKMLEVSEGKDTTTGHWELAGLVLDKPFKTYLNGFPEEVINEFIEKTGCQNILGNYPASGTAILEELGQEHANTKYPIIYTSADSVFQIACNVEVTTLETLYKWCEIAREILDDKYNVSRVIARPFEVKDGNYKRISVARRDYSIAPYKQTVLNDIFEQNGRVLGIGKIEDIFVKSGITHAIHTGSNKEGLELTLKSLKNELSLTELKISECSDNPSVELIFVNLVDTDMLFGHRNDPVGYGKALEEIDLYLTEILKLITKDDLLIITADHGCDPTTPGTDHTREMVPIVVYNPEMQGANIEKRNSFADVASTVAKWLNINYSGSGSSII